MADKLCPNCGFIGREKSAPKGTMLGEIGIWIIGLGLAVVLNPLMVLIPLVYSLWRLVSRERICPKCRNPGMIPKDSPMADKLLRDLQKND